VNGGGRSSRSRNCVRFAHALRRLLRWSDRRGQTHLGGIFSSSSFRARREYRFSLSIFCRCDSSAPRSSKIVRNRPDNASARPVARSTTSCADNTVPSHLRCNCFRKAEECGLARDIGREIRQWQGARSDVDDPSLASHNHARQHCSRTKQLCRAGSYPARPTTPPDRSRQMDRYDRPVPHCSPASLTIVLLQFGGALKLGNRRPI
jgi:hypothetical protein